MEYNHDLGLVTVSPQKPGICTISWPFSLEKMEASETQISSSPHRHGRMVQAGYTEKTDIWSFGVMAYALLFNEFPYGAQVRDKDNLRQLVEGLDL